GLLFAAYYGHWFDRAEWYYAARAVVGSELLAGGLGFGAGAANAAIARWPVARGSLTIQSAAAFTVILIAGLVLLIPYTKPLIAPIGVPLQDHWSNGVCIQSTPSTCGPSSAATILHYFGVEAKESQLARECFSSGGGTENWYIARALRRRGLAAKYVV